MGKLTINGGFLRTPTIDLWQERRVAAKGTGRENKKPRLMAVSDGEGSE